MFSKSVSVSHRIGAKYFQLWAEFLDLGLLGILFRMEIGAKYHNL